MTSKQIVYLVLAIVLVLFSGFFSACDIIISSSNTYFLKKKSEKFKSYRMAYALSLDFPNTISTLVFSNNLVNIAISSLSTTFVLSLPFVQDKNQAAVSTITVIVTTVIVLIFGEILPKTLCKPYSDKLIIYVSPIIKFFKYIFAPFIFLTKIICRFLTLPIRKFIKNNPEDKMGDEELIEVAETIKEEGSIDNSQEELLKNAIQFSDTKVFEVMTPRVDVVGLDINDYDFEKDTTKNLLENSRIVIYEDNLDKVIGIISSKFILKKLIKKGKIDLREIMKKPLFVPRSLGIFETFKLLNEKKEHIAIVIDEYGGCEGIITMEDILEELVGDIWDETDKIQQSIKKISPRLFEVSGEVNIDDFFDTFKLNKDDDFDPDAYTTLSGFVIEKLGHFGQVGDKITVGNILITVTKIDDKVIELLEVKLRSKNN